MASATSKGSSKPETSFVDRFNSNKVIYGLALGVALAIAGMVFYILSQVVSTTSYYVLNQNVAARSQIQPEMLTEVVTSDGGQPRNALDLAVVQTSPTYAKFALNAGDIITDSNTGEKSPLTAGVPDDYTVMSFTASPQNAVAGKLSAGDYIDVISKDESSGVAKVVLRHVLITDAMTDPSAAADQGSTAGAEAEGDAAAPGANVSAEDSLRGGIPTLYTVALAPSDAVKLEVIRNLPISVVISPNENEKNVSPESIFSTTQDVFDSGAEVGDSGKDTDNTFGAGEPEVAEGEAVETE